MSSPGAPDDEGASRKRPSITCYPDGPVLVRGDVDLFGPDGALLPRRRRTVALCRCGHSAIAPWCDGTHKQVRGGTWRRRGSEQENTGPEEQGG